MARIERNSKNTPRAPTLADLERELGADQWAGLSERQRSKLAADVRAIGDWPLFLAASGARRGQIRAQRGEYVTALAVSGGPDMRPETLERMARRYRAGGAVALIDNRGRHRGGRPLDGSLVLEFTQLRAAGMTVAAAHRRMAERAAREGRAWCAISTLHARLKRGTTPYAVRKPKPDTDNFLRRGVSTN